MRIDEPKLSAWEGEFYAGFAVGCDDALGASRSRIAVRVLACTPSTQEEALRLAGALGLGGRAGGVKRTTEDSRALAVLTRRQVRGRGTRGRTWHDPHGGGMAMTLALPHGVYPWETMRAGVLSLASAVASVEGIQRALAVRGAGEQNVGSRIGVKWPNDITVCDHRGIAALKLGGILIERKGFARRGDPVTLVGIGINTWQHLEDFPAELRHQVSSLAMLGGVKGGRGFSRPYLAGCIAGCLFKLFHEVRSIESAEERAHAVSMRWKRYDQTAGLACALMHDGTRHEGVIERIEPLEWVHLRGADGEIKRLPAMSTVRERV